MSATVRLLLVPAEAPKLRESTLAAVEAAIIEASGNGEVAAYTVKFLQDAAAGSVRLADVPGLRETAATAAGEHFMQRSCLGCSCGAAYHGKYDDDALVTWHLHHLADAVLAAVQARLDGEV